MTWVKICGITNLEDALTAVEAGADALGFVFYEKSPRNIAPETARTIVNRLPAAVEKVGVFVHGSGVDAAGTATHVGLTAAQIHVDLSHPQSRPDFPQQLRRYLAVAAEKMPGGVAAATFLPRAGQLDALFLDSSTDTLPGGTGVVFDWAAASRIVGLIRKITNVVIAGGLSPDNVTDAIRTLHPWGVDVSSGVEASKGKKSAEKVRAFIKAVRSLENRN